MPKYWVKNYFAHGRFPEVGQKQKTEKKKERKRERAKVGDNNGQAMHGACKHAWRTQAAWANKISASGVSPKWVKSRRRKEERKSAITMVSTCTPERIKQT